MDAQIKLGRLGGVPIGLHYSWFLIALLIVLSLSRTFRSDLSRLAPGAALAVGIVTAALFFLGLLLHELAHAWVARARGVPVRSITLFALGGLTQVEHEAGDARTEFWMGIAGPAMSFLIGTVCLGFARLLGWVPPAEPATPLTAMLVWLGYINWALAVFNLIPGFPLDGGRILRAVIWGISGDPDRATRVAARVGQGVAVLFIVFGILNFFAGAGFNGIWLAFIGWFLLEAARATYARVEIARELRGVKVGDVMAREFPSVPPTMTLEEVVDRFLRTGERCFVVRDDDGRIAGLITPSEVRSVPREEWPQAHWWSARCARCRWSARFRRRRRWSRRSRRWAARI